jgi:S1-C subfamily serine protease
MAVVLAAVLVWVLAARPAPTPTEQSPIERVPESVAPSPGTAAAREPSAAAASVPSAAAVPVDMPAAPAAVSIEDVLSATMPSVVSLRTASASGSGFFLTADTVITNEHVVAGHSQVVIRTPDGVERSGRVAARQASVDLATVKLNQPVGHRPLPLGAVAGVRVGQEVLAIGSPLGIENTVTRGIVSGIRRVGTVTLLQTDAAINPGNSGGPLLNRQGQVIGITTLKLSRAEQMSFAVAIDHALPLLDGRSAQARTQPPLSSILPGAPRDASDPEVMRETAERQFAGPLRQAREIAANFRGGFDHYSASCNARVKWQWAFNPRDPAAAVEMGRETSVPCRNVWRDLTEAAEALTSLLRQIEERARQSGVLPGVLRDLFTRYDLDEIADAAIR